MKIFEIDTNEVEQVEFRKSDGSALIGSLDKTITEETLKTIDKCKSLGEQLSILYGNKPEDYSKIPVLILRTAFNYAIDTIKNPPSLTEKKLG